MTYIDSRLLDVLESLCQRFQVLTGRTNVWLAVQLTNLSVVVYFVWASLVFWNVDSLPMRVFLALFCGSVLYFLTKTVFRVSIEASERSAYQRAAKGLRNPRKLRDAMLRISFLTLCILLGYPVMWVYLTLHLSFFLLTYSLVVLTTIVLYLLACDPLPPSAASSKKLTAAANLLAVLRRPFA